VIEQLTDEWFSARRGKVTASRLSDVIATTRNGWGSSRYVYMAELVAERLTGVSVERFQNEAMKWGVENEPHARAAYEFHTDATVLPAPFVIHPDIPDSGASPDGLIGEDGLLEIKCPQTNTHIDTLLTATVPGRYITQMQWQMACTGRAWCDFVSFDSRMPEHMQLFVTRVLRDQKAIEQLEKEVRLFLAELNGKLSALESKYGVA
jgi:putative phage-type endonuclease